MAAPLYNSEILRLAVSIPFEELLADAQSIVRRVSPVCGSRVTASLSLDSQGRIAHFGQEVRACALGQASAAVLGRHILGRTAAELRRAHALLHDWLTGDEQAPAELLAAYPEIINLAAARGYPARHLSILLAFDAAAAAAEQAEMLARQG